MKKLMLVAAAAAMTNAFAVTQVYEIRMNLKTTECRDATIRAGQNPFVPNGGQIGYRDVSTLTIAGLIWACDCDYVQDLGIANNRALVAADLTRLTVAGGGTTAASVAGDQNTWRWYTYATANGYNPGAPETGISGSEGYIFWDARTGNPWGYSTITKGAATTPQNWTIPKAGGGTPMPTFSWRFLQRIGSRAEKVEGVWELADYHSANTVPLAGAPGGLYNLVGSGFGTARTGMVDITANVPTAVGAAATTAANPGAPVPAGLNECGEAIITTMSGNVAGEVTNTGSNGGCVFCGTVNCVAFPFCNCAVGIPVSPTTAAFGTWTLRYNQSLSRRLLGFSSIRECYRFNAATADMVWFLETWAL